MKDFLQNSASDAEVSMKCFVCQKQIGDGQWFCRLPQKAGGAANQQGTKILLCSTACAFRYFAFLETGTLTI